MDLMNSRNAWNSTNKLPMTCWIKELLIDVFARKRFYIVISLYKVYLQRLALLRKDAVSRNAIPKYDRKCMNLDRKTSDSRAKNEPFVIRFKMDKQEVSFKVFVLVLDFFKDFVFGMKFSEMLLKHWMKVTWFY